MPVTRFPTRAEGLADRMADFTLHLRQNGLPTGPGELRDCLTALTRIDALDPMEIRRATKTLLALDQEGWDRYDDLFDAFWFNTGRRQEKASPPQFNRVQSARPTLWQSHLGTAGAAEEAPADTPDPDGEDMAEGRDGRLIATRTENLHKRDLREILDDRTLKEAEAIARNLARRLRDKRSRRFRPTTGGTRIDLRATLRASLARGGEPLDLHRKRRKEKPYRIVALCDISGSMSDYTRVFLAFLKGLVAADRQTDAFLFHTRPIRVTPALRDPDGLRAAGRLSLMAQGFGGGTDIGASLAAFNDTYAQKTLRGRSVLLILSDGYCAGAPDRIGTALGRLARRARRIVWLNPLAGWRDYAPISAGMAAALPHLDALLPANTLLALAGLEDEFATL